MSGFHSQQLFFANANSFPGTVCLALIIGVKIDFGREFCQPNPDFGFNQ